MKNSTPGSLRPQSSMSEGWAHSPGRDSFYLTLSSNSSKQYFENNTIAHFSTQLARPVCSTLSYEVAVCEVFLPPFESWKIRTAASPIYLYCDVTQPVLLCDTTARLLRVLVPEIFSGYYAFPHLFYVPVEKRNFQSITLSFHTSSGQRYPFDDSEYPSTVVLHFRERSSL